MFYFPPNTPINVEVHPDPDREGHRLRLHAVSRPQSGSWSRVHLPMNEEVARQLHEDLGRAITQAYPEKSS